ncbi:hypothetical protein CLUG_01925 [Clavispora lusitaniae ATCC 42720]|uniref:Amino acid transporter transmembrane domain-containing protein n=1 Tax=Clavispora lusitaniae (strain ATCC 42720) TaxID=306902 RepID=C4Y143_CLAL4|nr:uncharacterized protein CLUG_01925 [Clavispora lusitaniae ATCC 42720]EEQ37802.1 hypothetical protein CLUG_01925 [Clavispora lusitaniae ATCC 42720]
MSYEADVKSEVEDYSISDLNPAIDYKNCSWVKTAGLLFSEYICLAIMSFPWSYSVLGFVPGLILTAFISLTVLYTGLIITDYCIANPHVTSVCDIGQKLFWNSRIVWYLTAACFLCNNTLIQALHVLVGAKYFNTISDNYDTSGGQKVCSIVFAVVSMIICFIISLPRTFSHMSSVGYFSAGTMFIAVILAMVFAGIQDHPYGYTGDPVKYHLWPQKGTTYVQGMSALLNIVYTFVGQITYPSFISQMKKPRDFKKALYIVTLAELIVFALTGSIVYVYVGNEYMVAPAFGSLTGNYKKIAFSFALPTIVFLGGLYSNVSSQFLFLKIFSEKSVNRTQHTLLGWATWIGLNLGLWVIAFIVAEVIPFFSDLLSLMSSLFDCWFGFVFWGAAYFKLKSAKTPNFRFWPHFKQAPLFEKLEMLTNVALILIGFYIFGPGTYATVDSIILSYQSGLYGKPFTCTSNAI